MPVTGTPAGRCLLTNVPVRSADQPGGGSYLAVPLLSADRAVPVGVLQVVSTKRDAFDDDDVAALTVIAQIARKALTESAVQAALHASEARYRALVDHLPETAVMIFDADMRLEMAAGPGARTWRYEERNVVAGRLLDEFMSVDDSAVLQAPLPIRARTALRPHSSSTLPGSTSTSMWMPYR